MKTYRIHIEPKKGKEIVSDPIDVRNLTCEQVVAFLNDVVKMVSGGYITMHVDGVRKAFMFNGMNDIYWTDS